MGRNAHISSFNFQIHAGLMSNKVRGYAGKPKNKVPLLPVQNGFRRGVFSD